MAKNFSANLRSHALFTLGFSLFLAVAGLLVYALPGGFDLEENVALSFFFNQRPQANPPENVLLVSIDKLASQQLGLANDPKRWPRDLHARLIDKLSAAGAAVIVFDIFFQESRAGEEDELLAQAMLKAGNVLVFSKLERQQHSFSDNGVYNLESLILPLESIHQAAAATAPFVLPKVPIKVNQFWTFHSSAGGLVSLPTLAFEYYMAKDHAQLLDIFTEFSPQHAAQLQASLDGLNIHQRIIQVRSFFKQHKAITEEFLAELHIRSGATNNHGLQALLALYHGSDRRYLNFYGPPRSIPTLSYHEVLLATPVQNSIFKDKVVFVGFAEERQPEQKDNFYTVFSQANGLDLSGVEIAATAFSNLMAQQSLRLPEPLTYIAIVVAYGLLLACLSGFPSTIAFVLLSFISAGLYSLLSLHLFTNMALWLPLFIPVLVQTPLALLIGLLWRHRMLNLERGRIRQAFGYYLPEHVVDELAHSSQYLGTYSERMFGVCMASDAAQYTQLAESLTPEALSQYMNNYYKQLFKPVRRHGGIISDVVGDSMLAIWSARQPDKNLRHQACLAALETQRAEQQPDPGLRTRLGLHAGEIMLGNIGALDHFEYRAMGDIVNTASRIEGLNKQLGTRLLVSDAVLTGLDGFVSRRLGAFRMVGKQDAIVIYELMGIQSETNQLLRQICEQFSAGLSAYQFHDWQAAMSYFQQVLALDSADGPSQFYLLRCRLHIQGQLNFPDDGVIEMQKK